MKIYIVICEDSCYSITTSIEKGFTNEAKAEAYAQKLNETYHSFHHYVVECEVE